MVVQTKEEDRGRVRNFIHNVQTQWSSFVVFLWNPHEKTVMGRGAKSWVGRIGQNINNFMRFLWNPQDKTVLGRSGENWVQISIFYLFYYSFLAALFAISITIVLGTLDPYVPRFQTRLQGPGISIQPRLPSDEALTSDILYNINGSDQRKLVEQMQTFQRAYGDQSDDDIFTDCPTNIRPIINRTFSGNETVKACRFNISQLGPCGEYPYGYPEGKPCILVKVNRIINWFPVAFNDLSEAVGTLSKAPKLADVLTANGARYNPYLIYIACYGLTDDDQQKLNQEKGVSNKTKYYPDGIPFSYFPYYGNIRSRNYISPVVAVQFTNIQRGESINVGCKAYARNIVDDNRMQIGYYNFKVQVDS